MRSGNRIDSNTVQISNRRKCYIWLIFELQNNNKQDLIQFIRMIKTKTHTFKTLVIM